MPNVIAIAKDHVALQFSLAGIPVAEIKEAVEAERACAQFLDSDLRLVIVQEEFRDGFSEAFTEQLERHKGRPLIVFCPSFDAEDAAIDADLSAVLKPAVGYEIRLE